MSGVDVRKIWRSTRRIAWFISTWRIYNRLSPTGSFQARAADLLPCLTDIDAGAGSAAGHYFHQDLHVAQKIFRAKPARHVDIGSRIDGFVAHILSFMPVEVVDIRPLESDVPGLTFVQSDATTLDRFANNSLTSISSLHAAEHFGLGRYGDPVDPMACFSFMSSLQRVLAETGRLYFSVPVGRERVEFNAHRVFAPSTVLSAFPELRLLSFSFVDDRGKLQSNMKPDDAAQADYGCGIFEFTK